jgi:hypothetical protein
MDSHEGEWGVFWFPRAGVGTNSGRASVPSFSGSHAPAWEPIPDAPASRLFLVPTRRRGNRFRTRQRPVFFWFPRAGVGTDSGRASVPSLWACGPATLARRECVPTPARGNEKCSGSRRALTHPTT